MAENSKEIHIVFQVLNFLCGSGSEPYNLSSDEKFLLIVLARHKGAKGIYPSITTLSKELKRSRRSIMRYLKVLEEKQLINIDKKLGYSNHYELSTTSVNCVTGDVSVTSDNAVTGLVTTEVTTSDRGVTQSIKINNKKEIIERARKARAALSDSFFPDEKINSLWIETASKSGKNKEQLLTKFKNLQKSKEGMSADWNAEFENFLINEKPVGYVNGKGNGNGNSDIKSTVKFFNDPDHPSYAELKRIQEIKTIQEKQNEEVEAKPQEHLSFREIKRRFELNKQHGELNNGNLSDNTARRKDS